MSEEVRIRDLEMEVKVLSRDLVATTNILDKLDVAVDKLTDISNSLSTLVTLQAARVDRHDESIRILFSDQEKKKEETKSDIEKVYEYVKEEVRDPIEKRLESLEKFKWIGYGMVLIFVFVVSYVVPNLDTIGKLLGMH